ncbi:hypothetical protein GGR56DRAFT_359621 [Xylariaceae sp. FL0804]|nr:hypothetical protein GGR56DRAFT_359621 [Xylariaceae sp. FL0804]
MFSSLKLWVALVLVGSATARQLIAYRTATTKCAQDYFDNGNWLVYTDNCAGGGEQLGKGVYTSPYLGDWAGAADGYFCAIYADDNAWFQATKVWIPQELYCKTLWWPKSLQNRPAYYHNAVGADATEANTIKLSQIDGFQKIQMTIPPEMVGVGNALGLKTTCAKKTDAQGVQKLVDQGDVDFYSFSNVFGPPQKIANYDRGDPWVAAAPPGGASGSGSGSGSG